MIFEVPRAWIFNFFRDIFWCVFRWRFGDRFFDIFSGFLLQFGGHLKWFFDEKVVSKKAKKSWGLGGQTQPLRFCTYFFWETLVINLLPPASSNFLAAVHSLHHELLTSRPQSGRAARNKQKGGRETPNQPPITQSEALERQCRGTILLPERVRAQEYQNSQR